MHILSLRPLDANGTPIVHSTAEISIKDDEYRIKQHEGEGKTKIRPEKPARRALQEALDRLKKGTLRKPEHYGETDESKRRAKELNISEFVQNIGFEPSLDKLLDVIHHYQKEIRYLLSSSHHENTLPDDRSPYSFVSSDQNRDRLVEEKYATLMHSLLGPVMHHEVTAPSRYPLGETAMFQPENVLRRLDALLDPVLKREYNVENPRSLVEMYRARTPDSRALVQNGIPAPEMRR